MTGLATLGADALTPDGLDLDVPDETVDKMLTRTGVLRIEVGSFDVEKFARFSSQLIRRPAAYREAATPRTEFADGVFSATDLPGSQAIEPHNESSYRLSWPGRILFGCAEAPATGGETTLTDVEAALADLPSDLVDEFLARDWLLTRTYHPGLGRTWQDAFDTRSRDDVHRYCRANDIDVEWVDDEVLRTRQVRRAVARHPGTGALLWFNHIAFWHPSSLAPRHRAYLESELGADGLPFSTAYGDGEEIPDEVVARIREALARNTVEHAWREGELLLLDNMRIAHGRRPFTGPRRVLVGMGDEIHRWATSTLDVLNGTPGRKG